MTKRQGRKKKKFIWMVLVIVILIIISIGFYFAHGLFGENKQVNNGVGASNPTKTSKVDGYISSSVKEAATGSMTTVADAGDAEWIKVPSTQNLTKFKDIS